MKLLIFLGGTLVLFGLTIYSAWVFYLMWAWFMVPFGLPQISIPWAIGIQMLRAQYNTSKTEDSPTEAVIRGFIFVTIALLIGWLAHLFM